MNIIWTIFITFFNLYINYQFKIHIILIKIIKNIKENHHEHLHTTRINQHYILDWNLIFLTPNFVHRYIIMPKFIFHQLYCKKIKLHAPNSWSLMRINRVYVYANQLHISTSYMQSWILFMIKFNHDIPKHSNHQL